MLIAAGILLIAIGLSHSILGEKYIIARVLRLDLPRLFGTDEFTKQTLRFAWHLTTIAWWGFAALLFSKFVAIDTSLIIVSSTFLVSGIVALFASKGRHLSWIVFLSIAIFTWLASKGIS